VDEPEATPPPSLAEEQKQLTRSRIRRAAMKVVAQRGFDATVDEIARESGVSPRTIFRHYTTQSSLIVATVKDMFAACGRRPIDGLPTIDDDLDGWLDVLAVTIHTRNAGIIGEAFWDIHAPTLGDSEALAELSHLRREWRRSGVRHLAAMTWTAAGGSGEPPDQLVAAFALNFSAFATQALMIDFDQTPEQIGALTAGIVKDFLVRELGNHRADPTVSLTLVADDPAAGAGSPRPTSGPRPHPPPRFPSGEVRTAEE
jgi:AcrR family transcriptional regulator